MGGATGVDLGTTTTIVAATIQSGARLQSNVLGEQVTGGGIAVPAPSGESWSRVTGAADVLGRLAPVDWLPDEFTRERGLDLRSPQHPLPPPSPPPPPPTPS